MTAFLITAFMVAYVLVLWFDTDVIVEYAEMLKLTDWFKINEYLGMAEDENKPQSYREFLKEFYSEFFVVRLLNCPICLSEWAAMVTTLIFGWILSFPALFLVHFGVAFVGLTLYHGYRILKKYAE